jgi:hypothetical protein
MGWRSVLSPLLSSLRAHSFVDSVYFTVYPLLSMSSQPTKHLAEVAQFPGDSAFVFAPPTATQRQKQPEFRPQQGEGPGYKRSGNAGPTEAHRLSFRSKTTDCLSGANPLLPIELPRPIALGSPLQITTRSDRLINHRS